MLFENPVPLNMRLQVRPRSVTSEKMAGIFTKSGNPMHRVGFSGYA